MEKNFSEVYNEGYVAGYNQHKVDKGEMTQKKADRILRNMGAKSPTEKKVTK